MSDDGQAGKEQPPASASAELQLERVVLHPERPPKVFHKTLFTALNNDVILDFGYIDLRQMFNIINALKKEGQLPAGTEPTFHFLVTDTFVVTPDAAADLFRAASRIVAHFQQRGLLPQDLGEVEHWLKAVEA